MTYLTTHQFHKFFFLIFFPIIFSVLFIFFPYMIIYLSFLILFFFFIFQSIFVNLISYDSWKIFLSKLSLLSSKRRPEKLKIQAKRKGKYHIYIYKEKVEIKDLENREWGAKIRINDWYFFFLNNINDNAYFHLTTQTSIKRLSWSVTTCSSQWYTRIYNRRVSKGKLPKVSVPTRTTTT